MSDIINHPEHYKGQSIETFDMMLRIYGRPNMIAYCEINAFKYRMRAGLKGDALTDLAKANWYENKARCLRELE
jgi:hypothetical protein